MKYITKNILLLSLVSLFTDISSEMLFPVLPVYLEQIGFTGTAIGLLEGFAEMLASYGKGFFGSWSDQLGKRKPFITAGYALSALSKLLMGVSSFVPLIFSARLLDRTGKGIRTSARDAMLSSETTNENKGKVFGFHRAMDTLGAAIGPICALLLLREGIEMQSLFSYAFIPAALSLLYIFFIKEKKTIKKASYTINPFLFFSYWKQSPKEFKQLMKVLLMFALFNSSDVFLILWVKHITNFQTAIEAYIIYNLVYALASFPAGLLVDKWGNKKVLIAGFFFFIVTYVFLPFSIDSTSVFVLFGIYGFYAACLEGNTKAWVTNICNSSEAATALGFYGAASGLLQIVSGLTAGLIWDIYTGKVLFLVSATGVAICMFLIMFVPSNKKSHS